MAGGEPEHRHQVRRPEPGLHSAWADDHRSDSFRDDGVVRGEAQAAFQVVASHRSKRARVDAISSPVSTDQASVGHGRANSYTLPSAFFIAQNFHEKQFGKINVA